MLARRERIALPSELAVASGSRLDPKSLRREERDHLVIGLALRRLCRQTVITPRSASIQVLFLKVVFVFGFRPASSPRRAWWLGVRSRRHVSRGVQQQHGEFAGDGDDGAFLFPGAAGAGEALAVFAQRTGRAEGAEDVMRGADQQSAHHAVAAFADAQLFVRAAALVAARTQTQITGPHHGCD